MEHTDFKIEQDLFSPTLKCPTRKGGHESEIVAGKKATHTLPDDLRTVLGVLERNNGQTADFLGKRLVWDDCGGEVINENNLDHIKKMVNLPDKKMSKLVELGLVRVEEKIGGNLNWIKGKAALK